MPTHESLLTQDPLPTLATPYEVLAALQSLPPGAQVATDADNTLWSGDVGDEVVRVAGSPPHAPWQPGQVDLPWYLDAMETDYAAGCRYAALVLQHVAPTMAKPVLAAAFRNRVRPRRWLLAGLQAAMARGVRVTIVSASPRLAVEVGAELFGLAACPIVAVDAQDTRAVVEPAPIGEGKVQAWQLRQLPPPDLALGDSRWDLPLLQSARLGLLVARACDDPWCDSDELA
jgi:hypothetical protein